MNREAEIARAVVTELQRQGYATYEEVSTGYAGKRADIVAVRGPVVMVVETKASLSLRLLDQLVAWIGGAHYIVGAVSAGRVGTAVTRYLTLEGIGLWKVHAPEIHEEVAPRLHRVAAVGSLRRKLLPEHRSGEYASAGSAAGGYWTPFRGTCRALAELVLEQPGIELRAAIAAIPHHYASARSAVSSLPDLIRKGLVAGVRLDDAERRLRLYPTDELKGKMKRKELL